MDMSSYRYRVVMDWIDPDTGEPQQTELSAHQFSAGKAGRIMATQTDGRSYNFSHFVSARLERIREPNATLSRSEAAQLVRRDGRPIWKN